MALSVTIEVANIDSINPRGEGWGKRLEVDVVDMNLPSTVEISDIIEEYTKDDILSEIGIDYVSEWVERETGMKLTDE